MEEFSCFYFPTAVIFSGYDNADDALVDDDLVHGGDDDEDGKDSKYY